MNEPGIFEVGDVVKYNVDRGGKVLMLKVLSKDSISFVGELALNTGISCDVTLPFTKTNFIKYNADAIPGVTTSIPSGYRKMERAETIQAGDQYLKPDVGFVDCKNSIGKPVKNSFKSTVLVITKRPVDTTVFKPVEKVPEVAKKDVELWGEKSISQLNDYLLRNEGIQIRGGGQFHKKAFYISRRYCNWRLEIDNEGEYCLIPEQKSH